MRSQHTKSTASTGRAEPRAQTPRRLDAWTPRDSQVLEFVDLEFRGFAFESPDVWTPSPAARTVCLCGSDRTDLPSGFSLCSGRHCGAVLQVFFYTRFTILRNAEIEGQGSYRRAIGSQRARRCLRRGAKPSQARRRAASAVTNSDRQGALFTARVPLGSLCEHCLRKMVRKRHAAVRKCRKRRQEPEERRDAGRDEKECTACSICTRHPRVR